MRAREKQFAQEQGRDANGEGIAGRRILRPFRSCRGHGPCWHVFSLCRTIFCVLIKAKDTDPLSGVKVFAAQGGYLLA